MQQGMKAPRNQKKYAAKGLTLIEDFEDEEYDIKAEAIEYPDLPDISELESMIDWDDVTDSKGYTGIDMAEYYSTGN